MAYSAYDELLQRRLLEHGGAAGMGGGAPAPGPINITPAGGATARPQMPSGIGGLLGRLFNGGGSSGPVGASRAQYMPEDGQPPQEGSSGPFGMGGFGDKLMDFSMGASLGRNPNESFQYGLQSLYQGIGNRRADKKAQAELNRTRQVAISMGIPEDIAMNAPAEILVNVIKEAYAAGLKPTILKQGEKAFGKNNEMLYENPPEMPDAKYVTFVPPNTIPGAVPQTVDVNTSMGRALAERLISDKWLEQRTPAATVNLNQGENAYDKKSAELLAAYRDAIRTKASNARKAIGTLGRMESAMADPAFYSGTGGEAVAAAKRAAASIGINPEQVSSIEEFSSLANQSVLNDLGSLGAGVSNKDVDFIQGTVASLDKSPAGNLRIIQMKRRLAERDVEVNNFAAEYEKTYGRLDSNFDLALAKWAEENPLFPAAQDQGEAQPNVPTQPAVRKFNPETGEIE